MNSCIYEGVVRHSRVSPENSFNYALFMMCLDLGELDKVFNERMFWSSDHLNLASFNRAYHLGNSDISLDTAVRNLVYERTGRRPAGPVRMLTQLRYFGINFNPVSFYYCYDGEGSKVETIIVEIHNTPWGEMFCYVLDSLTNNGKSGSAFSLSKEFHISPFMDMDIKYKWDFSEPAESVHVLMESYEGEKMIFNAELSMKRHTITGRKLSVMLIKYPFLNIKMIAAIYLQALRLWIKGAQVYTHPTKRNKKTESTIL